MKSEVEQLLEQIEKHGYSRLIFDMDCTVSRLELPWRELYKRVLPKLPTDVAESFLASLQDPAQAWGQIHNTHVDLSAEFQAIIAEESRHFEATNLEHQPNRELVEMIKGLPSSINCYLWSSNTRDATVRILKDLGLVNKFKIVVSRDDVRYLKPDPEGWLRIDDGSPKSDYLFIGDSRNDRMVAEAIGIDYFPINHFRK